MFKLRFKEEGENQIKLVKRQLGMTKILDSRKPCKIGNPILVADAL